MENENTNEEAEQQTEVDNDVTQHTHFDASAEHYQGIIDQQNKAIAERDARIDKLIEQMQGLVNSHGNYREPNAGQGMQQIQQEQPKETYEPLSSLDFSM